MGTEEAMEGGFMLCFAERTVVIGLVLVGSEFGAHTAEASCPFTEEADMGGGNR